MARTEIQKKKAEKIRAINGITAKSIITSAFAETGMKPAIEMQCYRAKVLVRIFPDRYMRFYVRYKDMHNPDLMPNILAAIADVQDALTRLGRGSCVNIG